VDRGDPGGGADGRRDARRCHFPQTKPRGNAGAVRSYLRGVAQLGNT